jgi:hypothetical protein
VSCRLVGGSEESFFAPKGCQFEGSLSQTFGFQPAESADPRYRFLCNEGAIDVYLDTRTGREVYAGVGAGSKAAD